MNLRLGCLERREMRGWDVPGSRKGSPASQIPNPVLGFGTWGWDFLVGQTEAELHRPHRCGYVLQVLRRGRFVLADGPVRAVEDVEHVGDQVEAPAAAD